MPAFLYPWHEIIISINEIVVPVRPIPAEQWTIDFSVGEDFKFHSMNLDNMSWKSTIDYPVGIPWSGQAV